MNANDLAYALACAAAISGLPWDGSVPEAKFIDRGYLGSISGDVDANGNAVVNSPRMTGAFIGNKAYFSERADEPVMAHEMTHYLQDLNGMDKGRVGAGSEALAARKAAEAQAYNVERLTPYECLNFFGTDWSGDVKRAAEDAARNLLARPAPDASATPIQRLYAD